MRKLWEVLLSPASENRNARQLASYEELSAVKFDGRKALGPVVGVSSYFSETRVKIVSPVPVTPSPGRGGSPVSPGARRSQLRATFPYRAPAPTRSVQ